MSARSTIEYIAGLHSDACIEFFPNSFEKENGRFEIGKWAVRERNVVVGILVRGMLCSFLTYYRRDKLT